MVPGTFLDQFCITNANAAAAIERSLKTTSKFCILKTTIPTSITVAASDGQKIFHPLKIQSAITTSTTPKPCKRISLEIPN